MKNERKHATNVNKQVIECISTGRYFKLGKMVNAFHEILEDNFWYSVLVTIKKKTHLSQINACRLRVS